MNGKRLLAALFLTPALANGQAFDTTVNNYVYVGTAGLNNATNPTMIYTAASPLGVFTYKATITGASAKINGVGLNQHDGYLYGMTFPDSAASPSSKLYRIGQDGVAKQVATLMAPATSAAISVVNTTAGFTDNAGNYIFTAYTYSGNPQVIPFTLANFRFYVGELSHVQQLGLGATQRFPGYTPVDISDSIITAAFQSFVTNFNYANPGASNGGLEDVALNPLNGKLYSYMSYPTPGNTTQLSHRPVVLDYNAANGIYHIHTVGTVINTTPNREIAGAYFDPAGNYYVIFTDATYAQVSLITGALLSSITANVPLAGNNLRGDLASNVNTPIATPVVLASFTGTVTNGAAQLQWASGVESGLKDYTVQKSTDGIAFSSIGTVVATGSNSSYGFMNALSGTAWYRLLLTDDDGAYSYSRSIELNNSVAAAICIYPTNIAGNSFNVQVAAAAVIRVYDAAGRQVSMATTTSNETTVVTVPFAVNPGVYEVAISDKNSGAQLLVQRVLHQ